MKHCTKKNKSSSLKEEIQIPSMTNKSAVAHERDSLILAFLIIGKENLRSHDQDLECGET